MSSSLLRTLTSFTLTAAAACLGNWAIATNALAAQFGQQDIPENQAIAIATPVRNGEFYSLMILEQISNQRPCWREEGSNPVQVDPLLLNFDFSGICERQTDSNGYSVRVAGQDLAGQYRLEVDQRPGDMVLRAVPLRDRSVPPIEIGRVNGTSTGFVKIQLNPGWRFTRRTYNNQPLNHIYLTHDAPLDVAIASATAPPIASSPPSTPIQTPPPPTTSPAPNRPPVAAPPVATASSTYYRVVVADTSDTALTQVRQIEPEAFRTSVDGQSVIQAGLFQQQQRAEEIRVQLVQAGLPVKILTASAVAVAQTPAIPNIPAGQLVVVIDPGHGGHDPGAIGIGGLREKDINIAVSRRVQQRLQERGITAIMTRTDDYFVDLDPRTVFANNAGADVFVSIHANSINLSRPDINGLETYYYSTGQRLAQTIHNSILQRVNIADRGVRQARFYVLRHSDMPAVLVETGFVTGSTDAARFRDPAAMNQMADAIADGILSYLGR